MRVWQRREERTDRRFALIAAVLCNIHRAPEQPPFEVKDFMPMTDAERAKRERDKNRAGQLAAASFFKSMAARGLAKEIKPNP